MSNPTDPYQRIIWSADVGTTDKLFVLLGSMPRKPIVKIDRPFFERRGNGHWSIFERLAEQGITVFDDAKITGVGRELRESAENHTSGPRPWMLNCMSNSLSNGKTNLSPEAKARGEELDSLKQFADVCTEADVNRCSVTVLTSKSDDIVWDEYNQRDAASQVQWYAEWLVKLGFTHLVCSPLEASMLRRNADFDSLKLVTPGIRPVGAAVTHQSRFTTPTQAFENGADFIVVGSPITGGPGTPAENLDAIAAEVATILN